MEKGDISDLTPKQRSEKKFKEEVISQICRLDDDFYAAFTKNIKEYLNSVHTNVAYEYTKKYEGLIKESKDSSKLYFNEFERNELTNNSLKIFFAFLGKVSGNFVDKDKILASALEELDITCDDDEYKKACDKFDSDAEKYDNSYNNKFQNIKEKYTLLLENNYLPFSGENPPNEKSMISGLGVIRDLINNGTIFEYGDGDVYIKYPELNNISSTEIKQSGVTNKGLQ